jgi:hypothetical protein
VNTFSWHERTQRVEVIAVNKGELVEAIEKAAQHVEPQRTRRRGRKMLGSLVIIGIGAAVIANDKIRESLGLGGSRHQRPPWEPRVPDIRNGEVVETPESTTTP